MKCDWSLLVESSGVRIIENEHSSLVLFGFNCVQYIKEQATTMMKCLNYVRHRIVVWLQLVDVLMERQTVLFLIKTENSNAMVSQNAESNTMASPNSIV